MIPCTIQCCSTLFHATHHMLFHVIILFHTISSYSVLFHLFQVIPYDFILFFKVIPYDSILLPLFHVIPSYSTVFHAIPCDSMLLHVIPFFSTLFQAIPYYATLFHVIPGYSMLFLIIPRYSTLFYVIPSFQTVGGRWLVVFVRHSLGVCARFQAFKLQQGQFGAIVLVCAFLRYPTLLSFHAIADDSMLFPVLFHVIPCYFI